MVEIYVKLIMSGKKNIQDVPSNLKGEVEKRIKELVGESNEIC